MNRRSSGMQPKHIFLILVIICLMLLILSSISSTVNNVVRQGINTILMPMQKGLNSVGSYVSDKAENMTELQTVKDKNEQLIEEVAFLREQNAKYQLQSSELKKYQELLEMKDQYPEFNTIGAHVIGENSSNWNKTVLIDRGSNDGIEVDMNVISQGGLVGVVTAVTANSSTVRTIMDHDCQVGAMALLTEETCVVRGSLELYEEERLLLQKVDKNSEIKEDYKIVTSTKSSIYQPGILIGYATDLTMDANSLTKSGYLIPVVDFTHLDSVLVITDLKETGK